MQLLQVLLLLLMDDGHGGGDAAARGRRRRGLKALAAHLLHQARGGGLADGKRITGRLVVQQRDGVRGTRATAGEFFYGHFAGGSLFGSGFTDNKRPRCGPVQTRDLCDSRRQ